jgi:hypothetical protein
MQAQQLNQAQDLATTQQSLQLAGQFGLANQDAALRAALANQGIDLSTGQLNTQNIQQVNLANQASKNQVGLANAANFLVKLQTLQVKANKWDLLALKHFNNKVHCNKDSLNNNWMRSAICHWSNNRFSIKHWVSMLVAVLVYNNHLLHAKVCLACLELVKE